MLRKVCKQKSDALVFLKFVQLKGLKIAEHHKARQLCVFQPLEIMERLCFCLLKIESFAFLFDEQNALPKRSMNPRLVPRLRTGSSKVATDGQAHQKYQKSRGKRGAFAPFRILPLPSLAQNSQRVRAFHSTKVSSAPPPICFFCSLH
jgi:hypothetical protein